MDFADDPLAAPGESPPAAPNEHRDLLRCSPLDVTLPRLRARALPLAALVRLATVYFPRVLLEDPDENDDTVAACRARRGQGGTTKAYQRYGEAEQRRHRRVRPSEPDWHRSPGHLGVCSASPSTVPFTDFGVAKRSEYFEYSCGLAP